jgi:hypothetical protein
MTGLLEIKLPEHVLEHLPSDKTEMVAYLSKYADEVLRQYEARFQRRVSGTMGGPLSRYEKSLLRDFVLDMILGKELRDHLEKQSTSPFEKVELAPVAEAK